MQDKTIIYSISLLYIVWGGLKHWMVNLGGNIRAFGRILIQRTSPNIMENRNYDVSCEILPPPSSCMLRACLILKIWLNLLYNTQDAIKALNTLQTNAQALAQIRQEQGRLVHNKLKEMIDFTERAGVSVSDRQRITKTTSLYVLFSVLSVGLK